MIHAIGNHLWQSTVFAGAIGLLTLALRKNRAAIRHGLWLAASVKFLLPFSLLIGLGAQVEWRQATPAPAIVQEISQPFALPVVDTPVVSTPRAPKTDLIIPALFSVWLCGFLINSLAWWRRWQRVGATLRAASPLPIAFPIRVVSAPTRLEPGVYGIRKPVLLLPEGIASRLTSPQLQTILAHELCHVRRRDNLAAAVHMAVEAMFWFHPLVWWIETRLMGERERACDEEVLRTAGNPQDYAEGILNVCRFYLESPLICASGIGGADLRKRVEAIMENPLLRSMSIGKKLLLGAVGVLALITPIALGIFSAPATHAQPQTAATARPLIAQAAPAPSRVLSPPRLPAPAPAVQAPSSQPASTDSPRFEVASIRLSPGCVQPRPSFQTGRLNIPCISAQNMIQLAYGTYGTPRNPRIQIFGGPDWYGSDRYDLAAKAENSNASLEEMFGPMMRALLEDRFKLKVHREFREEPVYTLTVAKNGPKILPTTETSCSSDFSHIGQPPQPGQPVLPPCGGHSSVHGSGLNMTIDTFDTKIADFLHGSVFPMIDRPVIDKTGLTGVYDYHLQSTRESPASQADPPDPSGPSIFTAFEDQLGLKLSAGTGPVEVLVIDQMERPSEN